MDPYQEIPSTKLTYLGYHRTSNVRHNSVRNEIVDHSDVTCRCCSNDIFILELTPGFNVLGKDNCKFFDFVSYIRGPGFKLEGLPLEVLQEQR